LSYKHVVMLLDGTCAAEEDDPFARPKWSVTNSPPARPVSDLTARAGSRLAAEDDDPYGRASRPDFPISEVQWEPFSEPFPMDLRAQVPRARQYVTLAPNLRQNLMLTEIHLWRYLPVAALEAANKPTDQHLHHWEVVFWFRGDSREEYDAHMLLDGTVLSRMKPSRAASAFQGER
jgi:hypothetical protein